MSRAPSWRRRAIRDDPLPPYAELLGLTVDTGATIAPMLIMPFATEVLGRPGFLHGGAISGLMEMAAIVALHACAGEDEAAAEIKPINVTVDFMRGGRDKPTLARGDRHAARHARRQCRGDRLAGRPRQADRRGADELSRGARLTGHGVGDGNVETCGVRRSCRASTCSRTAARTHHNRIYRLAVPELAVTANACRTNR